MNTEITVNNTTQGWVYYDAECAMCVRAIASVRGLLDRHGYQTLPLQTPDAATRIGVTKEALMTRMHLLTANGRRFAGADAVEEIAREIHWARPFVAATRFPGVLPLLRRGYDWVAAHRNCGGGACRFEQRLSTLSWLPLVLLPAAVFAIRPHLAPWVFMWTMAVALYAGCKWLTFQKAVNEGARFNLRQTTGYLFAWVGMEPEAFAKLASRTAAPDRTEWAAALTKTLAGALAVWGGVRFVPEEYLISTGWLGMIGLIFMLHFGLFHLIALGWRRAGVAVKPLMRAPLLATSLGEFWGARWNTGFHTLAHEFAFRPLRRILGGTSAMLMVFFLSGIIHELVITVPARDGYGLPTAYFLLQGLGLAFERSVLGKRLTLGTGNRGRIFTLLVTAAPVFWLFPPVFVRNIILPMLHAIGAT